MTSYYAKITLGVGAERLVGVVSSIQGGLLRVVDVDPQGKMLGQDWTYVPANVPQTELIIGPEGFLIEKMPGISDDDIDWSKFEVTDENLS